MKDLIVSSKQKKVLVYATAFALIFSIYFLSSYAALIVLAGILAFLFNPIYVKLQNRMKPGSASALTLVISVLAIVIPLFAVILFAGVQLKNNFSDYSETVTQCCY
jgi:predicted PurR-regulated permease PerM